MAKRRTKKKSRRNPLLLRLRNPSAPPKRRGKRRAKKRSKAAKAAKTKARKKRAARPRRPVARRAKSKRPASNGALTLARRRRVTIADIQALARRDKEFARALARYRKFHGGAYPDEIVEADIDVAKPGFRVAVGLGDTVAHEYKPPNSSGRAGPPYRHRFRPGRQVTCTAPSGKGVFIAKLKGSRMRVTDRGIID